MAASRNSIPSSTAKAIALAFGGSGVASGSGWYDFRCPAHNDKTVSCGVTDDRDGKITVKCHAGCERDAILDAIEAKGLIVRKRSNRRAEKKPPEGLFGEARVVEPSLAYFPARGLDSAALPDLSRAVRFAPRCWHAASKEKKAALIAALTDEAGNVRAIQRLYLTADYRGKACKPMSLGQISGLAIKLGPPTDTLYIAKGLEDAMTAQQASEGKSSAWAAAGSSNMPNLVGPDAVKTVVKAIGLQHGGVTAILPEALQKAGKKPGEITIGGADLGPATIDGLKSGYVSASLDQLLYMQGFMPVVQCLISAKFKMPGLDLNTGAGAVTHDTVGGLTKLINAGIR
jgi:hypothetical protein